MAPAAPATGAPSAGAAAAAAAAGGARAGAAPAPAPPGPWLVTSEHLDPDLPQTKQLHLVVLNWHLPVLTARLWQQASTRMCADGGANRLHDQIPQLAAAAGLSGAAAARDAFLPDVIKGDLDSVRPDVRDYYTSRGVPMVDLSADQDTTDLTKCLMYLDARIRGGGGGGGGGGGQSGSGQNGSAEGSGSGGGGGGGHSSGESGGGGGGAGGEEEARRLRGGHAVVVLGALGGRLDHIIAHLNNLYAFPHLDITLCGDGNLVRLLPRGRCLVRPHARLEGPTCGLVPLAAPAVTTTKGLRWNLDKFEMRFRGLISTSNIIDSPEVEVAADEELIWITELAEDSRGDHSFSWGSDGGPLGGGSCSSGEDG
ncbi:thiamin pyrophosphokinase [Raphidocelis subcapitata]|uniref:thiamine diphosphokinase n=1 Tax=Raphidocelis subcapitata TaxID=307507 RepID=A0A2V0P1A1_9CHLO|nr:thiamin pyrophosphokinase [Raphidocelis subcapitata]|eukprot:GBF93661.1 thiamin pyrophosphokinase [Raphidocelis subcapitata]